MTQIDLAGKRSKIAERMPHDNDLPAFIRAHLNSVWALEILLLLRREAPRVWKAEELVGELRASVGLVAASLTRFQAAGLVVADEDGAYAYAPAPGVVAICDRLEAAYRERPVTIINLISAPEERLQQLADAFRFRGEGS